MTHAEKHHDHHPPYIIMIFHYEVMSTNQKEIPEGDAPQL